MRMRLLVSTLAVCVGVSARASFELLHVLDTGSKTIKRFDSETGAYLGQYGQQLVNPTGLAYLNGRTYTMDSGTGQLVAFNAYTGAPLRTVADASITAVGTFGNSVVVAKATTTSTFVVAQYDQDLNFMANYTWNAPVATGWTPTDISANSGLLVTIGPGGWAYASSLSSTVITGALALNYKYAGTTVAGTVFGIAEQSIGNLNPRRDLVGGHVYNYYSGQNSSNVAQGRISVGSANSSIPNTNMTFGESVLITPTHLAIQNAPEPGTWVALGLGGLALIRRRKA